MEFFKESHGRSRRSTRLVMVADILPGAKAAAKKASVPFALAVAIMCIIEVAIFAIQSPKRSFAAQSTIVITSTASTTWTVPSDWNNASNTIEVIGGGGGGDAGTALSPGDGGGGGGGGAYAKIVNTSLTPGASVGIHIGTGGGAATAGGDTYLCNATSNCASLAGLAVVVGAQGGGGGSGTANGAGGTAASSTGSVKADGGAGAAGTTGSGNNGGNGGGGGGAAGCGVATCASGSPGAAGNAGSGQAGGRGDGTFGGTGGGADTAGNNGLEWSGTYGSGGGGGGGTGGAIHANGNPGQTGGTYGAGGSGGGGEGKNGTTGGSAGSGTQGIIVITYSPFVPTITVSSTGSQVATTTIPSAGFAVGGAFTFARDSATATVSQIVVTASGTLDASANLSNLILYYDQTSTCATSSIPGTATQFNGAGVSFDASERATTTGSMSVGTAQMCMYAKVDVGSSAGSGQTFTLTLADPAADVTVDSGNVSPATAVALGGETTLPTTALTAQDFRIYANADSVQPSSSLAAENASATDIASGEIIRIRANVLVGNAPLATSSVALKLQYAPLGGAGSCTAVPAVDFADVGAFGSSTPWRGFDNASTTDGATTTATLLASSTVNESYVEENPSPSNPAAIPVGGAGEWDFVVEDHAASSGVAYCFRIVQSTGVTFDSYVNDPAANTVAAATWRAAEDTPTSTKKDFNIRLRVEVSNNGNASDSAAFQLEYATSTAGPWAAVPVDATCSLTSAAFRECPSSYFADLDPTTNELTAAATTFISGFMLSSSSPAPSITLDTNQFTELEWNIQATDAAVDGQTYYFRVTDAGTSIGTYSVYPQLSITAASSTFTQNYYRWYANTNALTPSDPWPVGATDLGENTAITSNDTPPKNGDAIRLRMSVLVGNATLPTSSQAFKLQYGVRTTSCSAVSSWTDVSAPSGSGAWRGFVNSSVTNGTALSTNPPTVGDLLLSVSNRAGSYVDTNPSPADPYKASIGDNIEYDWSLEDNNATSSASYCFRMVKSDGTALDAYTYYPTLTTAGFDPKTQSWRFYSDASDETPVSPLANENVAPSNVANGGAIKLRITVKETNGLSGADVKFRLQFSQYSDFSQGVTDVAEIGSCSGSSEWCYASGAGADNSVITTGVLSDSDACSGGVGNGCGTHNTSGVSSSTFTQAASAATEYEFTIAGSGAQANATYFFRLVNTADGQAVPLNTTSTYPSLSVEGSSLTFTVSGVPTGTSVGGVTTTISATPGAVSFGELSAPTSSDQMIGANQLVVDTGATNGYQVFAFATQQLLNDQGDAIPDVSSTNAAPATWSMGSSTGAFGYHTTDATLSGADPTRFAANDTYAAFTNTGDEVAYASGPVASDTTDLVYRLQVGPNQLPGSYSTQIGYIVVTYF